MTYIAKPRVFHPSLEKNELGLTRRDYEGVMSTLCAGCGHDSITAALIEVVWDLAIPPHRAGKNERDRLLIEDDRVLHVRVARLQLGSTAACRPWLPVRTRPTVT